MSVTLLFVTAALQAVQASELQCTLVTPRGDVIGFTTSGGLRGEGVSLTPARGAVWPTGRLNGVSDISIVPAAFQARAFALGDPRTGMILHFGTPAAGQGVHPATIYRRSGRRAAMPLAYGHCMPAGSAAIRGTATPAAVVEHPAFDPGTWPSDDCAMVTSAGRRVRIDYSLQGPNGGHVTSSAEGIFPQQRVPIARRQLRDAVTPSVASFSAGRDGPAGLEMAFVQRDPNLAVQLIHFQRLGGAAVAGQTGFAICGHNNIIRRPAAR